MEGNPTRGQKLAVSQILEICEASNGGVTSGEISWPQSYGSNLIITITIDCSPYPKSRDGLPLRNREEFQIVVGPEFPFKYPVLYSSHKRFHGFAHIQWGSYVCLYQSANEWHSSDGMYGFFDRIRWFLIQGALGELDPVGGAIHPPATFPPENRIPGIIPLVNSPHITDEPWYGFAELSFKQKHFCEIVNWHELKDVDVQKRHASAFLLSKPLPPEFPTTLKSLIDAIEIHGINREIILLNLQFALLLTPDDQPLVIVFGTPMRGTAGTSDKKQHLTAWRIPIDSEGLKILRESLQRFSGDSEKKAAGEKCTDEFRAWIEKPDTPVEWLPVKEMRPEIVLSRDMDSSISWFKNKSIVLWGCGGIGSSIAEILVRAGAKKLLLCDKAYVSPGILVRQNFTYGDNFVSKVNALKRRLLAINPSVEIVISGENILSRIDTNDWKDFDLIIESTGSNSILEKLEYSRAKDKNKFPPLAGLTIGHNADFSILTFVPTGFSGGIYDVERKLKIETARKDKLKSFNEEFWPRESRSKIFQPEPGCSDPTYIGSLADLEAHSSRLIKILGTLASKDTDSATSCLVHQPPNGAGQEYFCDFVPDLILKDFNDNYQIRVSSGAWKEALAWRTKSRASAIKSIPETGGVIFGEYNDASSIFWIDEITGPPKDSKASQSEFICGVEGLAERQKYFTSKFQRSIQCVGMWHTHPGVKPLPSSIDLEGMNKIFNQTGSKPREFLLLIIGDAPKEISVFSSVFHRAGSGLNKTPSDQDIQFPQLPVQKKSTIGLALSGGGSRAMAFHLGCLRALHHRGLLEQVSVMSCISGGSLIGAAYAYSNEDFEVFEKRIENVLRKGFAKSLALQFFHPYVLFPSLFTFLTTGLLAIAFTIFRYTFAVLGLMPFLRHFTRWASGFSPVLPRWYNRSDAFIRVLDSELFRGVTLADKPKRGLNIFINSTELKSGTSFRFGNLETRSSRLGVVDDNNIPISEAVAASACFPILLPPLERTYSFKGNPQRVQLIDGGVYDNLGITPFDKGRNSYYKLENLNVDYLISCSAGEGVFGGDNLPHLWHQRMIHSFNITFRRVQEGMMKSMASDLKHNEYKGWIFPYLGVRDNNLPYAPFDLVPREKVHKYPTDFFAMSKTDLMDLSDRGEQLTRYLINLYCPEL